jgi:uncharacterized ion transporter superfamily protein YfcC
MTDRAPLREEDIDITAVQGDGRHWLQRLQMPDVYIVLGIIILLAAAATWFVPAGTFDRVPGPDGRESIDPDSYTRVPQTPVGLLGLMTAIPTGIVEAVEVVVFTLMIGGTFMVLRRTGIIEVGIDNLAHRFAKRGILAIPALMLLFALIATVIGTQELALVYVPILIPLMIALGFDSVTAAGVALLGTTAGFCTGILNPINTGLGQKIAGIELYSGKGLRTIAFVLITGFAIVMVTRYARRVAKDPARSLLADDPRELSKRETFAREQVVAPTTLDTRQRLATGALLVFLAVLVWGVLDQGWFMVEMSGLFIVLGIVVGVIAGLSLGTVCEAFNVGFREVLVGAIIAGVARAVAVVLEEGQIIDTIVHALGNAVGDLPGVLAAAGMFFVQFVLSFIVSSGSGQALVTMPIMAPLADVLDITRQTAVLAYQLADGTGNVLFPTSGYFMAVLALAGVPWQKWLAFYLPIYAGWVAISLGLLTVAQIIGWS